MNVITPSHTYNENPGRTARAQRYMDVIEEETIPTEPAETLEAAARFFMRQMSNESTCKLRRAMINQKKSGSLFRRSAEPAETLEAATRSFMRQMSNESIRKLRRAMANQKKNGDLFADSVDM